LPEIVLRRKLTNIQYVFVGESSKAALSWAKRRLPEYIPIIRWLPSYQWKQNLISDLIAGISVGAMAVPQVCIFSALVLRFLTTWAESNTD
jgi:hypothetical protein